MNTAELKIKNIIEKEKSKAIFYDRDGTLVEDHGYVHKVEDFKLLPNVIEGLKLLKDEFIFFIVTNQSGIGRGYYNLEDVNKFNDFMLNEFKKHGIEIGKIYICPHPPEDSCDCRKPNQKFPREAEKEFNINLQQSYVIGDHEFDIEMGQKVGCKKIFMLTGHGNKHVNELKIKPDFIAKDLLEAAKWILDNK